MAEALALADGDCSVIGGAEVFRLFEDIADRAECTAIWRAYDGDAMFDLDQGDWEEVAKDFHAAERDLPAYTFFTLEKRR